MVLPVHDENPLRRTPWVTYAGLVVGLLVRVASPPLQYPVHPRYR